jgi:hypothetical protein
MDAFIRAMFFSPISTKFSNPTENVSYFAGDYYINQVLMIYIGI